MNFWVTKRIGRDSSGRRDYGMFAIITLIVLIAIWLIAMPLVPAIARATLNRFHLNTSSFVRWAVQFPIPAMYNFANRYEVRLEEGDLATPNVEAERLVNHFPARIFTFADGRYFHLRHGSDCWLLMESSYRGQSVRTCWHAEPTEPQSEKRHLYRLHRVVRSEP